MIRWRTVDPPGERIIVSYVTLRRIVGALGLLLPVVVAVEWAFQCRCAELRPSISEYYDVQSRDLFVGILFTIAWFLIAYRGHERKDDLAGTAAGIFALGVALVPYNAPNGLWAFHFIFATALFLTLAYFSLRLFTKTSGTAAQMTEMKRRRNGIYRACGWIMLGSIGVMAVYKGTGSTFAMGPFPVIYTFETLALWAFGYSWMVKGETWWRDNPARTSTLQGDRP